MVFLVQANRRAGAEISDTVELDNGEEECLPEAVEDVQLEFLHLDSFFRVVRDDDEQCAAVGLSQNLGVQHQSHLCEVGSWERNIS